MGTQCRYSWALAEKALTSVNILSSRPTAMLHLPPQSATEDSSTCFVVLTVQWHFTVPNFLQLYSS